MAAAADSGFSGCYFLLCDFYSDGARGRTEREKERRKREKKRKREKRERERGREREREKLWSAKEGTNSNAPWHLSAREETEIRRT